MASKKSVWISFMPDKETLRMIEILMRLWGTNRSSALRRIVERAYQAEISASGDGIKKLAAFGLNSEKGK